LTNWQPSFYPKTAVFLAKHGKSKLQFYTFLFDPSATQNQKTTFKTFCKRFGTLAAKFHCFFASKTFNFAPTKGIFKENLHYFSGSV
jgi:hypothetical protein